MPDEPVIDLLSAATFASGHPWAVYEWLRDNDPVHWHDESGGPGFWVITRWEDIRWVNAHGDLFSHAPTSILEGPGIVQENPAMVNIDPPLHTVVRKMAITDFLPGAIRQRFPSFLAAARDIIEEVRQRGECDLAVDVAGRMASYVTADMLGISREDAVRLYDDVEIGLGGGTYTLTEREAAIERLMAYGADVYEERRHSPGTDVCSHLVHGPRNEGGMCPEDFVSNFALLVVGAGDTTRHLIGGGMLALLENPDQRAILEADLDHRLPSAVEEMLRFVTPVIYNRREALSDVELHGRHVTAGDKVVVYYGAGNRDPRQFREPEMLDVLRTPNNHVAFSGQGAHFCLGAHVARAEATAMFRVILTELPEIHQVGPLEWANSNQVMGPAHFPVEF